MSQSSLVAAGVKLVEEERERVGRHKAMTHLRSTSHRRQKSPVGRQQGCWLAATGWCRPSSLLHPNQAIFLLSLFADKGKMGKEPSGREIIPMKWTRSRSSLRRTAVLCFWALLFHIWGTILSPHTYREEFLQSQHGGGHEIWHWKPKVLDSDPSSWCLYETLGKGFHFSNLQFLLEIKTLLTLKADGEDEKIMHVPLASGPSHVSLSWLSMYSWLWKIKLPYMPLGS